MGEGVGGEGGGGKERLIIYNSTLGLVVYRWRFKADDLWFYVLPFVFSINIVSIELFIKSLGIHIFISIQYQSEPEKYNNVTPVFATSRF